MAADSNTTQHLITQRDEFVKQYITFDGSDRPEFVYTAPTDAEHGTPCSQVQYEYRPGTSSQVLKMKESAATWDSSWDI